MSQTPPPPERQVTPSKPDVWANRMLIGGMVLTILSCIGGVIFLGATGRSESPLLGAVATTAVGAMAAMTVTRHYGVRAQERTPNGHVP